VATLLADPPATSGGPQPEPGAPAPSAGEGPQRRCSNCGAALAAEQDWCLQCGAGVPGSVQAQSHQWRAGAAVLSAVALLITGAAVGAYAALSKSSHKRRPALATLALAPARRAAAPGAATAQPPTASATPTPTAPRLGLARPVKPLVPLPKPPKIPLVGATPKSPAASSTPKPTSTTTTTTPASNTSAGSGSTTAAPKQPVALTLDTNAASTYNPYSYPASNFGDPSLAIDGETSTAWTALVEPSVAPRMAEGLLIDMKGSQRLSALVLTTSTPGMTVQVYGASGHAAPASITDPAWARLSGELVAKQRSTHITLANSTRAFRFVTLWISKAPASAVGTPRAPGHVKVNELELFPAA
jgi:hypothetical protein